MAHDLTYNGAEHVLARRVVHLARPLLLLSAAPVRSCLLLSPADRSITNFFKEFAGPAVAVAVDLEYRVAPPASALALSEPVAAAAAHFFLECFVEAGFYKGLFEKHFC